MIWFLAPLAGAVSAIGSAIGGAVSTVGTAIGTAATTIGTAASSAGQFLSSITSKIPTLMPPLPTTEEKVKKVLGFLNELKKMGDNPSYDEIRNMESYNPEDTSISQLQNLNNILNNMKSGLKDKIIELEEVFSSTLENSFNSIESFIKEDICSQGVNIDIYTLRDNFDKLIKDFKSSFYDDINNKISLSDYKCLQILEIKASEKRLVEMNSYIEEVIKNQLDKYFDDLDFITNNTIQFIHRSVEKVRKEQLIRVDMIKKELEENIKLDESEIEEKRKEYDRKEKIIDSLLETIKL